MSKLFVVVRADLPVGLQLAQVAHVAVEMASGKTALFGEALATAHVAVLHARDRLALEDLLERAHDVGVPSVATFYEPDLGGQLTAIALFEGRAAGVTRHLPLAFCGAA